MWVRTLSKQKLKCFQHNNNEEIFTQKRGRRRTTDERLSISAQLSLTVCVLYANVTETWR